MNNLNQHYVLSIGLHEKKMLIIRNARARVSLCLVLMGLNNGNFEIFIFFSIIYFDMIYIRH